MLKCPRCEREQVDAVEVRNALSRHDNRTYACSSCGVDEAMLDWKGQPVWPSFPEPIPHG